jgi:hypothetical protein
LLPIGATCPKRVSISGSEEFVVGLEQKRQASVAGNRLESRSVIW